MKVVNDFESLFAHLPYLSISGVAPSEITSLESDSRACKAGSIFIAIPGVHQDGFNFVDQAIANGAVAIVSNRPIDARHEVYNFVVEDVPETMGYLASRFYGDPSRKLQLVGVTGTNGKTSVVTFLYRIARGLSYRAGLISTIEYRVNDEKLPATHTTPGALELNALLARMVEEGCEYAFMEVSSHAIVQKRIAGVHFAGGVFTNLSHDHLDYHKNITEYRNVKKSFFASLPSESFALTCLDDVNGEVMISDSHCRKYTYALNCIADFRGKLHSESYVGLDLSLDGRELTVALHGIFNVFNLLAAYATSVLLGFAQEDTLRIISGLRPVPGRFDFQVGPNKEIVVVDYAHTPAALKSILHSIFYLGNGEEDVNIITVFGCGGDRDKSKRPEMGEVAALYSEWIFLTSDNPRSEDPQTIIDEIKAGIPRGSRKRTIVELDRREAIRKACLLAGPGEYVVIAGKGHETYQEIKGIRSHLDDREEVYKVLSQK